MIKTKQKTYERREDINTTTRQFPNEKLLPKLYGIVAKSSKVFLINLEMLNLPPNRLKLFIINKVTRQLFPENNLIFCWDTIDNKAHYFTERIWFFSFTNCTYFGNSCRERIENASEEIHWFSFDICIKATLFKYDFFSEIAAVLLL